MPAQSKSQQRFFGVVKAMQKGDIPKKGRAGKIAKTMSKDDVDDFASTKHKGKPEKVKREQRVRELIKKMVREELNENSDTFVNILNKFGFKKGARDWGGHQFFVHKSKNLYATYNPNGRSLVIEPKRGGKPVFDSARSNFSIRALLSYLQSPKNKFVSTEEKLKEVKIPFSSSHIKQLKRAFKDMKGTLPDNNPLVQQIVTLLKKTDKKVLKQIASADIKYLSDKAKDILGEGTCGYGENGQLGEEPAGPHLIKKKMKEEVEPIGGMAKIAKIVKDKQHAKVGGQTVDMQSANLLMKLYNAVKDKDKEKMNKMNEKKLIMVLNKLWSRVKLKLPT